MKKKKSFYSLLSAYLANMKMVVSENGVLYNVCRKTLKLNKNLQIVNVDEHQKTKMLSGEEQDQCVFDNYVCIMEALRFTKRMAF